MNPLFDDELGQGWAYLRLKWLLGRAVEEWLIQVLERRVLEQAARANNRAQASYGSRPAAVVKERQSSEEEEEDDARFNEEHITRCDGRVGGLENTEISEEEAVEDPNIGISEEEEADEEGGENDKEVTIQYGEVDDLGYYADSEDTNRDLCGGHRHGQSGAAGHQGTWRRSGGSRGALQFVKGEDLEPGAQTQVRKTTKARRKRSWRDLGTGPGCHEDPRDHEGKMAKRMRIADKYL